MRLVFLILAILIPIALSSNQDMTEKRPVWITTDIGGDPDDIQSMIHLLQYSDMLDIKGITAGYPTGKLRVLQKVLAAYRKDYRTFEGFYNHIKPWQIKFYKGQKERGDWSNTKAVRALVTESYEPEYSKDNPLIILSWGACTDVAAAIVNGLNKESVFVYFIAGFDPTDWNARQDEASFNRVVSARKVRRIFASTAIRGMYFGWDIRSNRTFVKDVVAPRGELGKLFLEESRTVNTGSYSIKMGDTPSVLWALTSNNLNPEKKTWGGQFVKIDHKMWGVLSGRAIGPFNGAKTVKRRRALRHWKKQLNKIYS